jgi:hypothetical protein
MYMRVGTINVGPRNLLRAVVISSLLLILDTNAKSFISRETSAEPFEATTLRRGKGQTKGSSFTVPLIRRSSRAELKEEDYGLWARIQGQNLNAKYGGLQARDLSSLHARANGTTYLLNREYILVTYTYANNILQNL